MIASNVYPWQLQQAAALVGVKVDISPLNKKGARHRVKVSPKVPSDCYTPSGRRKRGEAGDAPYQRTSVSFLHDERRVNAVCWHGFRDFFRAVFRLNPDAVFQTAVATWKGSEDFEARYRDSGFKNIGAPIAPVPHCAACRCPESGRAN